MSIKPLLIHPELYEFEEESTEIIPDISDTELSSDEEFQVGSWSDLSDSDPSVSDPAESDTSSESSDTSGMEIENSDSE